MDKLPSTEATIREMGAVYTPRWLANVLAQVAIDDRNPVILDPSFGKCSLLLACLRELRYKGFDNCGKMLFGIDTDSSTRAYLSPLLNAGALDCQFLNRDFLTASPADFKGVLFSVVLANPPFTRRSALQPAETEIVDQIAKTVGLERLGNASYWTYFLLHALDFLQKRGKLVFILPSSLVDSEYGRVILKFLRTKFEIIKVIVLTFGPFLEAQVSVAVLVASNYGASDGRVSVSIADNSVQLRELANARLKDVLVLSNEILLRWRVMALPPDARNLYAEVESLPSAKHLGDVISVNIGLVTGANEFFVINNRKAKELELQAGDFSPIISNGRAAQGVIFSPEDYDEILTASKPSVLLRLNGGPFSNPVKDYLRVGESKGLNARLKCRIRKPWYSLDNLHVPDGFFQYMKSKAPHLLLNSSKCTCTNALHRISFKTNLSQNERRFLAVSVLTSFTQLSLELMGRSYGGGVLKIEPGTLVRIPHIESDNSEPVEETFIACDEYLRRGSVNDAIRAADDLVMIKSGKMKKTQVEVLFRAWKTLVEVRLGHAG